MPGWAKRLASVVPGYRFSTVRLWDRHSVAAERVSGTTGPVIVITSDENEMRAALGVTSLPVGDSLKANDQATQPTTEDAP
jgi:hypothetical protein